MTVTPQIPSIYMIDVGSWMEKKYKVFKEFAQIEATWDQLGNSKVFFEDFETFLCGRLRKRTSTDLKHQIEQLQELFQKLSEEKHIPDDEQEIHQETREIEFSRQKRVKFQRPPVEGEDQPIVDEQIIESVLEIWPEVWEQFKSWVKGSVDSFKQGISVSEGPQVTENMTMNFHAFSRDHPAQAILTLQLADNQIVSESVRVNKAMKRKKMMSYLVIRILGKLLGTEEDISQLKILFNEMQEGQMRSRRQKKKQRKLQAKKQKQPTVAPSEYFPEETSFALQELEEHIQYPQPFVPNYHPPPFPFAPPKSHLPFRHYPKGYRPFYRGRRRF